MKVRSGGGPITVRNAGQGRARFREGRGYDLRPSPDPMLRSAWTSDHGGRGAGKTAGIRRLRREYAHAVGGSSELAAAADMIEAKARANAAALYDTGESGLSESFGRDRELSDAGVPVDYVIWNDASRVTKKGKRHVIAGHIELGHRVKGTNRKVKGAFFMSNAVRGRPVRKARLTAKKKRGRESYRSQQIAKAKKRRSGA